MTRILVLVLLALSTTARAKHVPFPCAGRRFLVQGAPLVTGGLTTGTLDAVAFHSDTIEIASGCTAKHAKTASTKKGVKLTVSWSRCGTEKKTKLVATVDAGCTTLAGTFKAKPKARPAAFTAVVSTCGDGVVDPGNDEVCEPPDEGACDGICHPRATTTTTSTTMPPEPCAACDPNAVCTPATGCVCDEGFSGDGRTCTPLPHGVGLPALPRATPAPGGVMSAVRVVSVVPANFAYAADVIAFGQTIVTGEWLAAVAAEYGGATSGTHVSIAGPAIVSGTDMTIGTLRTYVGDLIAGTPNATNGSSIYVVYLPLGVTFAGSVCTPGGAHNTIGVKGDAIAFVHDCGAGVAPTVTASHEIIESITDTPLGDGYVLNDNTAVPPVLSPWAYEEGPPHAEVADMCEATRWTDGTYAYTRVWSNAAAAAGGDPCVPAVAQPYYNVWTRRRWYDVAAGGSVDIPLNGWTTGTVADWDLTAEETYDSTMHSSADPMLLGVANVAVSSATTQLRGGTLYPTIGDGRTATLHVSMPPGVASGTWVAIEVASQHLGPLGKVMLDPDAKHMWFVGVIVP